MSDWNQFKKRVTIRATTDSIYRAWTTGHGIESWFLRSAEFSNEAGVLRGAHEFAELGDNYLWKWHGWSDEANLRGNILAANGRDYFQFTFHDPMVVSIRILSEFGTNIVELVQTNIATDEDSRSNYFVGCGEGWTFYLTNLKSVLEGGLDLRNQDVRIRSVVNS